MIAFCYPKAQLCEAFTI